MPVSPNIGQDYAERIAVIYRDAELAILRRITAAIAQGIDQPEWATDALARGQVVRAQVVAELARVNPAAAAAIRAAVADAYDRGGAAALADIGGRIPVLQRTPVARVGAVAAIVDDVARGLTSAQPAILRRVDDIFRQVVAEATLSTLSGIDGRKVAAQAALNYLAGRGIDAIEVGRGTMSMTDYLSMAVRTSTSRAAIEGTTQTMTANNIDLVAIQPGPRACDICDTWARSILTIDPGGVAGELTVDAVDGSGSVTVDVAGSLDDARDDGWGHPNCRCSVVAYLPGVTDAGLLDRPPWDADGYAAQQAQRVNERQIRNWKTREATAITDAERERAAEAVAAWQERQRDHLAANEELKRQYSREQVGRIL